ncbi:CopG family ribbon-helix-helix protein [Endozoicomonas atrinae]|uniref:CopG family ribbon-helix-helix protein n=1 Tax=Endozoicomonas atrinae TaxID=1333660 RepID=UPI0008271A0B|nr:ribbon-helix-helix protein, CopG family [Endozoicomonas atrinae]
MSVSSVRLNQDIEEPLNRLAKVMSRSRNFLINEAVREYIRKHAREMQEWDETLEALDQVRRGDTVDGDAVMAWLDSWGSDNELEAPE